MTDLLLPPEFELFGLEDVESIDWSNPVSDDPLNDDLKLWLLAGQGVPGGFGGDKWIDLTRNHICTLTSMDPATAWDGAIGNSGWGSLSFSDSDTNDYVSGPTEGLPVSPVTIVADIVPRTNGGASGGRVVSKRNSSIQYDLIATTTGVEFQGRAGTTGITLNVRNRIVATFDGTTVTHFLNGKPNGSGAATVSVAEDTSADLRIGGLQIAVRNFDGWISEIKILSKVWGASEASHDFDLSSTGQRGLLNRVSSRSVFVAGGATTAVGRLVNGGLVNAGLVNRGLVG